ncbi:hypothetical protein RQP46_000095 [Phenoliferia psychrophenolica]
MAERLSGYGASNDSDYFIFPSCGKGYVPLTSFEYGPDRESHLSIQNDPTPSLRFTTFTPATTARLLSIPPTFLPIFASLIGNDQSDYFKLLGLPNSRPRFVGEMDPASLERIARKLSAASALPADTPAEVEIILRTTVLSLLEGKPIEDVEMIPTLLRSAHSYRLQPVESESPTFPLHPTPNDTPSHAISRATYLKAFQHGQLGSLPLVFLKHGLVDPPTGVDDPDRPSPSLVFGAPIRLSIYAILAHELHTTRTEVTEHNRWRDRLVVSTVAIPSLAALVQTFDPPLSLPAESISTTSSSTRLSIYLSILSAPPFLRPPPPSILPHLPLVLALLHIQRFSSRPWPRSTILSALLTSILLDSPVLPTFPPLASPPRRAFIHTSAILATVLFHISVLAELDEVKGKYYIEWAGIDPDTGEAWKPTWEPKKTCGATKALISDWKESKRLAREEEWRIKREIKEEVKEEALDDKAALSRKRAREEGVEPEGPKQEEEEEEEENEQEENEEEADGLEYVGMIFHPKTRTVPAEEDLPDDANPTIVGQRNGPRRALQYLIQWDAVAGRPDRWVSASFHY